MRPIGAVHQSRVHEGTLTHERRRHDKFYGLSEWPGSPAATRTGAEAGLIADIRPRREKQIGEGADGAWVGYYLTVSRCYNVI